MATSEEFNQLLSSLNDQINVDEPDYNSIEETSLKCLELNDGDVDVWKCLCVSLLFQNKETELVKHMKNSKFRKLYKEDEDLRFYRAYTAYRQDRLHEVKEMLGSLNSEEGKHLRAQLFYRQENFQDALNIYQEMNLKDDPHFATNVCACSLGAGRLTEATRTRLQMSMFHYQNVALGFLRLGQFTQARRLLEQAAALGVDEGESEEDLAELKAMLAYCLEQLNESDEALKIYQEIEQANIEAPVIKLMIAANKSATINFDGLSALERFCILDEFRKLRKSATEDEAKIVEMNYITLLTKCGQNNAARSLIGSSKILSEESKIVLLASIQGKKNVKMALETVGKGIESLTNQGQQADDLKLIQASLLLRNKRNREAIDTLKSVVSLRHFPGLVSIITKLYSDDGDLDSAIITFDDAIQFWTQNEGTKSEEIVLDLQMGKANLLLKHNKQNQVMGLFENMMQKESKYSTKIQAHLIEATSYSDINKAANMCDKIPDPENLPNAFDLIQSGCVGISQKRKLKLDKNYETIRRKQEDAKRRKKENKVAKENPNPQRWEPRFKRKRRKKEKFRGAQGAV